YVGDPEQFWRLCDANAAMRPEELTGIIGRVLRITLPEGIPGAQHE
ncbi:MAG: LysM domain-containing protein, partial [Nitrospiraceae bacterium]